jgi:hypothetical protein
MFLDPAPPRPDAAERTERHLATVAELLDDARQLARHAARKALRHAEAEEAAAAAGLPPPQIPRPGGPDPGAAFCRMSREVCRLVTLEMKIANGWRDPGRDRSRDRSRDRRPDRDRWPDAPATKARVRSVLREAVIVEPGGPSRTALLETIDAALANRHTEEMLTKGAPLGDAVDWICRGFGLRVDADRLPEEALRTTWESSFSYRSSTPKEPGPDPP